MFIIEKGGEENGCEDPKMPPINIPARSPNFGKIFKPESQSNRYLKT